VSLSSFLPESIRRGRLNLSRAAAFALLGAALLSGCASLPEISRAPRNPEAVRFENGKGPLTSAQSAAILERLKKSSGETSILDRHVAVEQFFNDSPLIVGNHVTLLKDGKATYAAMFAAIGKAKDHINLETYIFEDDEVGRRFSGLLIEKQQQGVQVSIIYDSVGTLGTPRAFFERLQASGIRTLEFNPINPLEGKNKSALNHRDHRKLLIVDGRVAFLGGINISSVYSGGSASRARKARTKDPKDAIPWRDTHVQIEGPVVAEYQKLFLDTWERQKLEPLSGSNYFPKLDAVGKEIVHAVGSTQEEAYSRIYVTLISAINSAETSIYVTNAYFVPDPQLLEALKNAAKRGVDVRIILPSHTDFWAVFHAGRSHYGDLLRAGVNIYERQGPLLHSKTVFIDGVWSCIGSTNLDWRSFVHNNEVDAVVLGDRFTGQMRVMFEEDMAESRAIDLERWERRPFGMRMKEWSARLWEYWL
jgi:cardiolipin synthase